MSKSDNTMNVLHVLEHSQWAEDHGIVPWRISPIGVACRNNTRDCLFNFRGPNKWQLLLVSSEDECKRVMAKLSGEKDGVSEPSRKYAARTFSADLQRRLLTYISANPGATLVDIADALAIESKWQAMRLVNQMIRTGALRRSQHGVLLASVRYIETK